jgi:protein-S-isoprenylcysteine O-methyltransferase Ste14
MNTGQWTTVIGGTIGLALALFGARMLITGRAPDPTARAFRNVREAGCYHLLFGMALVLVVAGTNFTGNPIALIMTLLAVAMVGVAVIRFRPRGRRSAGQK